MHEGQIEILYMKVVFYLRNFPKPTEPWIIRQANALRADIVYREPESFREDSGFSGQAYCIGGSQLERTISRAWFAVTRRLGRSRAPFLLSRWESKRLKYHLKQLNAHTLLAHFGPNGLATASVSADLGIAHFTHFNGYDLSTLLTNTTYTRALGEMGTVSTGFVVVNSEMREHLLSFGVPERKIHIIPYGVPTDTFSPSSRAQEKRDCEFVFIGRFTAKKSPDTLIHAFKMCHEVCPSSTLTMAGGGQLKPLIEQITTELGLSPFVKILDRLNNEEVRDLLLNSDVYVQHSVTAPSGDKEGWPVIIGEAAASGLPVIATRHAGIVDQVVEGETGYLVDEHDVHGTAQAMIDLAQNPQRRLSFGQAARNHIVSVGNFSSSIARLSTVLRLSDAN